MKKFWNNINKRINIKWYVGISATMAIFVSWTDGYNWWEAAIFGLIFFILFSSLAYITNLQEEKQENYYQKTYGDDPDWEKYRKLKKKFNNR